MGVYVCVNVIISKDMRDRNQLVGASEADQFENRIGDAYLGEIRRFSWKYCGEPPLLIRVSVFTSHSLNRGPLYQKCPYS